MICYLGLGSNLGERYELIQSAIEKINTIQNVNTLERSSLIETEPYGKTDQPDFINCVIKINTGLSSLELLKRCLKIEDELGRLRSEKWGARTIDIDILFYGDKIIKKKRLEIPHPGIAKRRFVLRSLNEICPEFVHPVLQTKIKTLYKEIK